MFSRDITTFRQRAHRSLAQAFPKDHAYPIEHYRRRRWERIGNVLLPICIGAGLAILIALELAS